MNATAVSSQQQLARYAAVVAACGALGGGLAGWLAREAAERNGALVGIAVMVLTAFLSLWLKRRGVERSLNSALLAVVTIFLVRMVVLSAALLLGMRAGLPAMAMVIGFFGEYFVLQVVEIRFALVVHGQRSVAPPQARWEGIS